MMTKIMATSEAIMVDLGGPGGGKITAEEYLAVPRYDINGRKPALDYDPNECYTIRLDRLKKILEGYVTDPDG